MTTPLQQAAQAVIKQCEADALWATYPWVGAKLIELRKALADEQAQVVEPFEIEFPDYHGQAMRYGLEDRNITDRYEAMRYGWDQALERVEDCLPEKPYTHPAPPAQAVEPVATVQCINGVTIGYLDAMQPVGTKLYTHPAPPPAMGERAELIAGIKHELAEFAHNKTLETLLLDAADMLESDVSFINEGNKAQQVAVPAPMSGYEISKWWASENGLEDCDMCIHGDFEKVVRAVEAHHKIGAKPETGISVSATKTDWSAA